MGTTPSAQGARSGFPGNLDTTNASAGIDQYLGTHGLTTVYEGAPVLIPSGGTQASPSTYGNTLDLDQPFTMSGTTIGRVVIPVLPFGAGADMLVSLWPDNGSGAPNMSGNPLAATAVPAAVTTQLAAPDGLASGGPLATEASNGGYFTGGIAAEPWAPPAADGNGASLSSTFVVDGNYFISLGGNSTIGTGAAVAGVATIEYLGGGSVDLPAPQPALPLALSQTAAAVCSGCIVTMGGGTGSAGNTASTAVNVASWDADNGIVGSWSVQTALPVATFAAGAAGYGTTVYMVGGLTGATNAITNAVYYASITNGQIGTWVASQVLPVTIINPMVTAVDGWLIVIGGFNGSFVTQSSVFYAPIHADGSLGGWEIGPSLPTAIEAFSPGFNMAVAGNIITIVGGLTGSGSATPAIQTLAVTSNGLADFWRSSLWNLADTFPMGAFATGGGFYDIIVLNLNGFAGHSQYSQLRPVPLISVPLPVAGLSNGTTYHMVLQQHQTGSASDYLAWMIIDSGLPQSLAHGPRHGNTWTTQAGFALPIAVYDTSATGAPVHAALDVNSGNVTTSWSTLLYDNSGLLTGVTEATLLPNNPLNSNSTFTSGVIPWAVAGGTFAQSAAQTHGGLPFSGLLTPSGSAASAIAQSELVPVASGANQSYGVEQWYYVSGWVYSPPGSSTVSLSVSWYDHAGNLLSTSSNTVTIPAAAWTFVSNYFECPAGAAQAAIAVTESGTPASSKLLYLSNVSIVQSPECVGSFTSVASVDYASGVWPPTSITQLN